MDAAPMLFVSAVPGFHPDELVLTGKTAGCLPLIAAGETRIPMKLNPLVFSDGRPRWETAFLQPGPCTVSFFYKRDSSLLNLVSSLWFIGSKITSTG
jgi:hypothetical protein